MIDDSLIAKIQDLSDLELAALLCFVAQEHCIIDTEPDALEELILELELVAAKVFGLSHAVIDCSEHTSLDDFANAILNVEGSPAQSDSPARNRHDSYFHHTLTFQSGGRAPTQDAEIRTIANVIIAKNLDEAPKQVQIQALELMRTRRIYARTSVQTAPRRFLFIAVLAGGEGPRLTKHLNNHLFISHFHDPEDGFPNLEDMYEDSNSISSVVRKSPQLIADASLLPRISAEDIQQLSHLASETRISMEVKQYQQNIIAFLRLHRAVGGGISAVATQHFDKLIKCLASLHGLPFATPSFVALAVKKIYLHRIHIIQPEKERSMQWGSDIEAVAEYLATIGPEEVIEDVLGSSGAEAPL